MTRMVGSFEVGRTTPERVLREAGLWGQRSVEELVAAAAPHDAQNPGYLSLGELQRGAADLVGAPPAPPPDAFEYSASVLASVQTAHPSSSGQRFRDADVVGAAAAWDNGNGYLNRAELTAGAMELQVTSTGQPLRAADIAAIRTWTGATRQGAPPPPPPAAREIGVISDVDQTLMPPEQGSVEPPPYPGAAALLTLLERGPQGNGALGDVTYVTARTPARTTTVPAWLAHHGLPAGPLETGVGGFPFSAVEQNKFDDIERTFLANPGQRFVLFGDSSHRDADAYRRVRDAYPSQVAAVIIHRVSNISAARVAGHHVVNNYAEAAAHLMHQGIIDEPGARAVIAAARREGLVLSDSEVTALLRPLRA